MNSHERQLAHDRLAGEFDELMNAYDIGRRLEVLIDDFLGDIDMKGKLVLDAGCGTGRGTEQLSLLGASVVALDYGLRLLRYTTERYTCEPVSGNVIHLPFADNTFDVIFSSEVIEHTPDPLNAVKEMVRILKPGGRLVLSTPNHLWQFPVKLASRFRLRPYDGLENFIRPKELHDILAKLDGTLLEHRGLHLIPFQFTLLQPLSRLLDRWGKQLLPLMINQCVSFEKSP